MEVILVVFKIISGYKNTLPLNSSTVDLLVPNFIIPIFLFLLIVKFPS